MRAAKKADRHLMSLNEVAEYIGVSIHTARKFPIPRLEVVTTSPKTGRKTTLSRFNKPDVDSFILEHTITPKK